MSQQSEKDLFRHHAKTFSQAARFFSLSVREDVTTLYAFCRSLDDAVDLATTKEEASHFLDIVKEEVYLGQSQTFPRFQSMMKRREVSRDIVLQLIDTLRQDLVLKRIETEQQLLTYCMGVASTVGVILCRIFSIKNLNALPYAIDLGIAMQMTNIARDVYEDAKRGKIYIPTNYFPDGFFIGEITHDCQKVIDQFGDDPINKARQKLLKVADRYYRSGTFGYSYLPGRVRFAVASAASMYKAIGKAIEIDFSKKRAHISNEKKLLLTLFSLHQVAIPPKGIAENNMSFYRDMVISYGTI